MHPCELETVSLFDLEKSVAGRFLARYPFPWQALDDISKFIEIIVSEHKEAFWSPEKGVFIGRNCKIERGALILPPALICSDVTLRTGAYLRGRTIVGRGCVVGNSSELKNCILFDGASAPHFNYVGDSILGAGVHLGAGAICSNLRSDGAPVSICACGMRLETGRRKAGAFAGDGAEVGCNAVLNPGTVLGKCVRVYPLTSVRGFHPARSVVK